MKLMKSRETKDQHTRVAAKKMNSVFSQSSFNSSSNSAPQNSPLAPARTPASTTRPETSLEGKLQIKAIRKFGALLGLS